MASKAKKGTPMTIGLNLREAQDQAALLFKRARKQVDHYLPDAPRKRLVQLEARVERATKDLEKAGERAVKKARARVDSFVDGVESFFGGVEKSALGAVKPLVSRLDVASKSDVDRLRKRIAELEKRVTHRKHPEPASAAS